MSSKQERRSYTKEFKIRTVKLILDEHSTVKTIAEELGIDPGTIRNWKRQYLMDQNEPFPGKGHLRASDQELKDLRKKVYDLEEENEILKKAIHIFSQKPK